MLPVVNAQEMRNLDQAAIRRAGVPSLTLMENAGRSVVDEIEARWGTVAGKSIAIVAGKGNNGGDGFVVARHALERNAAVTLVLAANEEDLRDDAMTNYGRLTDFGRGTLKIVPVTGSHHFPHASFDFIVDAIFGTAFHGDVSGATRRAIGWISSRKKSIIISVDIPSGLDATTGERASKVVHADLTVTFALPKIGLFVGEGRECTGRVVVTDIGIPKSLVKKLSSRMFLVEQSDVARTLPVRSVKAHKYSVGKIFVLAGSKGLTGAALLSSQSAMRSGAGAVVLGVPSLVFPAVAKRTLEVMPLELPSTREGSISREATEAIKKNIAKADAVLIGPGLSTNAESQEVIRDIVTSSTKTLVIDADGLTAVSKDVTLLKKRKAKHVILTPHAGEFSRLTGLTTSEIEKNRISCAQSFAQTYGVTLVLKGAPTLVAARNGKVYINPTGNAGMATAGSGDVLGGIIVALLGQGSTPLEAAVNGVYVHGVAGDLAKKKFGEMGLIAGDILENIPSALKSIMEGSRQR